MKAIIEIPKGDDRRRHLKYDKSGFIDLGPIKDVIPINDGVMPVHYGYIPETKNPQEGDEIDILVLSKKNAEVGQELEVKPIALIRRADGDDKVVAVDESRYILQTWMDIPQETRDLIQNFFGYHHAFLSIEDGGVAERYTQDNLMPKI